MAASTGYTTLLRANRDFRWLWITRFLALLGDSFNSLATKGGDTIGQMTLAATP